MIIKKYDNESFTKLFFQSTLTTNSTIKIVIHLTSSTIEINEKQNKIQYHILVTIVCSGETKKLSIINKFIEDEVIIIQI